MPPTWTPWTPQRVGPGEPPAPGSRQRRPREAAHSGAAGAAKDVKNSIEFLEKFDCVVINFDSDKAGLEAAKKVARLLTPGKAKIQVLPDDFKDANDMLVAGKGDELKDILWKAIPVKPEGIVGDKLSIEYPSPSALS